MNTKIYVFKFSRLGGGGVHSIFYHDNQETHYFIVLHLNTLILTPVMLGWSIGL